MAELNEMLYAYSATVEEIKRVVRNLKKMGKAKFTIPILQARATAIHQAWNECRALDQQINKKATADEKKTLEYFTTNFHETSEECYWEANDYIIEAIAARSSPVRPSNAMSSTLNDTVDEVSHNNTIPLPRIPMPTFNGAYTDWVPFRDLFTSLVINNESISTVQKLHYLKVSVTGEASSLLSNITITGANFAIAWKKLQDRYDNSRHIIDAQLMKLFDIPAVTTESIRDLKRLRDVTNESVSALANLDTEVDTWDKILTFMTVRKLDSISRREWEMKIGENTEYPTYEEICNFLDYRIRALEAISPSIKANKQQQSGKLNGVKSHLSTALRCLECGEEHYLYRCERFKTKSVEQRQKLVRENCLCFNCLSTGHKPAQCPSKHTCQQCKQKHHTLLHDPNYSKKKGKAEAGTLSVSPGYSYSKDRPNVGSTPQSSQAPETSSKQQQIAANTAGMHVCKSQKASNSVMLATAWVRLESGNHRNVKVRALLDQGSQSSFILESIIQSLRAPRTKIRTAVSGLGGTHAGTCRSMVHLALKSCRNDGPSIACNALVFQNLTSYVPQASTCATMWKHLQNLELADPDPGSTDPIQLILGADIYAQIILDGVKRGPPGSPIAQNTTLGWVLSGPTTSEHHASTTMLTAHHVASNDISLSQELRRFWELEEIPSCSPLSEEEQNCEKHFAITHRRMPEGRYCVKLPFRGSAPIQIGASTEIAVKWLLKLEKKFDRDSELVKPYCEFIAEYLNLGHMIPTTFRAPESTPAVFLPHHPVIKDSSTTRLRVVFNASARTSNGTSLNDHLMVGPKLQADLPATILRWRVQKYAFTADITKMYRQILVDSEDTRYQQILWRRSPSEEIVPYRLTTVTYGTASAPYLAMRVLRQLADDEEKEFPLAAPIVRQNFYVDDVLFGANDQATAISLRNELEKLLAKGGFTLRKWMASHSALLEDIPKSERETTKCRMFDSIETIKILGIGWIPEKDSFCFNTSLVERHECTKRTILSVIAKLFDPLGWLSPVLISAKILMQELWIASVDWDEKLPPELETKWEDYYSRLSDLHAVSIPRWTYLESTDTTCQLHGFADASTRAYAAVIYLRVVDANNEIRTSLLAAKSKVAPIKTISVPRLELCAAALLAKLIAFVRNTLSLTSSATFAWTDSKVVLAWLRQHPSEWPTFVANRVATIQHLTENVTWSHVPTAQNPADCASRGLNATAVCKHPLWWQGPQWLREEETSWPQSNPSLTNDALTPEKLTIQTHIAVEASPAWELCNEISSWPRLLRVTAYCFRIAAHRRRDNQATDLKLTTDEITNAKQYWLKAVQSESFPEELHALKQQIPLPRRSRLRALIPFVDENGILRVGGRLQKSTLTFDEKHPIILPKHRVSTLIVENAHLRCLHGGPQLTTSVLRQSYWILGHRPFVRNLIHKCVQCVRERAIVPQQIMGNLPAARTKPARPFAHCGLDYAGPFLVRTAKGRGHKSHKSYIALFVCLSTRAIHLELVSDYSSETFLAAFRRFVSRRGFPSDIYSDNGTTFQGADKELRAAYRKVVQNDNVINLLATDNVKWHFIPPGAPHFGGLWEAGVKCVKHHLRRVLGAKTLTFEELTTLIIQIEACLNSRPIGPTTTDPCDFTALTPGHFLIGTALTSFPEPSLLDLNENRLSRWQLVRQTLEHFWKRWAAEYLHTLQLRTKWTRPQKDLEIGDLVLVRNENLPPAKWQLGRVTECHPGPDDRVRVVSIKTAQSNFKRPITQVCVLPVNIPTTENLSPSTSNDETAFEDCDESLDSTHTISD